MSTWFWIRRFFTAMVIAFVIISTAQILKGLSYIDAATHGSIWSIISAAIFTSVRIYDSRRGRHCAICVDTPETRK